MRKQWTLVLAIKDLVGYERDCIEEKTEGCDACYSFRPVRKKGFAYFWIMSSRFFSSILSAAFFSLVCSFS